MRAECRPFPYCPPSVAGLLAICLGGLVAACSPSARNPAEDSAEASAPAAAPADRRDSATAPTGPAMPPDATPLPPNVTPLPPDATPATPIPTVGTSSAGSTRGADTDSPILRAVRAGVQPGADRLVFEFEGAGLPGWHVEYVDRPVHECGSGDVVRLPGDAWLLVRFSGARAHDDAGQGTTGPKLRTLDQANLLALARTCDFEGEVSWVAAVRSPRGYTPRVLSEPSRLVVDIAH